MAQQVKVKVNVKPGGLSLIPRTRVQVEENSEFTKLSSGLHMDAVLWVTTHTIINFQVAGPEQGLDQERWQMAGRGSGPRLGSEAVWAGCGSRTRLEVWFVVPSMNTLSLFGQSLSQVEVS